MTEQHSDNSFGFHILVAEDNKVNQMVARKLLEKLGCSCDIANDGIECIEMFAQGRYDLILMDCMMPNMGGLEATRRIRADGNSQIPIIAFTANAMDSDQQDCLEAGMNDFMGKPIDVNRMRSLLKHWSERLNRSY